MQGQPSPTPTLLMANTATLWNLKRHSLSPIKFLPDRLAHDSLSDTFPLSQGQAAPWYSSPLGLPVTGMCPAGLAPSPFKEKGP